MKKILSILLVLFFVSLANSQGKPLFEQSAPNSLVYDEANLLSSSEKATLEEKLNNFDRQTSTQILVAITNDLYNYDVDDYAARLLETWHPGKADKNNGLVILIKTKSDTKGQIAISTGYGIEPFVTDAVAKRIIEVEVIPQFKNGNYYNGIDNAINTIISLTQGEFTADNYMGGSNSKKGSSIPAIVVMVVLFIIFGFFGRRGGGRSMGGSSLPFWLLMGSMGSSRGSGFGGFSGGSGGFGGFGGGMGGGGGASGSW